MRPGHAEIVGGGFCGLVAAMALAERGWSVRVHERRNGIDAEGYGLPIIGRRLRLEIPPSTVLAAKSARRFNEPS